MKRIVQSHLEALAGPAVSGWRSLFGARKPIDRTVLNRLLAADNHTPTKTIILCADERAGSNLLAQTLASTGVLGRAYEYFNTPWMREHYADYPESVSEQMVWAKRLGTTRNGVFSFKLHPWMMDRISDACDVCVDLPEPSFILLRRRDLLGQAISLLRAHQTRSFTSWTKEEGALVYDGGEIEKRLQRLVIRRERWELYFARTGKQPLRLDYEQLAPHPQHIASAVARHAGVRELAIVNRREWHVFERQADATNDEWRRRFMEEHGQTRYLDVYDTEDVEAQPSCALRRRAASGRLRSI